MIRKAKIIRYNKDKTRAICVDVNTWNKIKAYLKEDEKRQKKFNYIVQIILNNLKNRDVYDKEDINKKASDLTAMKLFKNGDNDRIYCKEMTLEDKTFVVITCELYEKKKSRKNKQAQKNIINKIAKTNYEIIREEKQDK